MAAHELVKEVEGGLMAEQRVPALASTDNTISTSNAPTLAENHHLEKTATHSSHAQTDIAGEKGEKDVDPATPEDDSGLLSGARLYLVFLSLMLAVLVSLACLLYPPVLTTRCSRWTSPSSPQPFPFWSPTSMLSPKSHGSSLGMCYHLS